MRLIDADELIEVLDAAHQEKIAEVGLEEIMRMTILTDFAEKVIRYAPTIDTTPIRQEQAIEFLQKSGWLPEHDRVLTENAVPVVRCKDCKWWTKQEASLQGKCDAYGMYPTGEWYCARGERR